MQLIVADHDQKRILDVKPGDSLLAALQDGGISVHAPCGGKGTCQKCQVTVIGLGQVLACRTNLTEDLYQNSGLKPGEPLVVILPESAKAQISTDGLLPELNLNPSVYKGIVQLPLPSLNDQRPDDERFTAASGKTVPYALLSQLPAVLRETGFKPSFYFRADFQGTTGEVLRFVPDLAAEPLGVAVDIGTTTLAAYLYDLGSGLRLAAASCLNPQRAYGADVISRIEQAALSSETSQNLKTSIVQAIADLAARLVRKARKSTGTAVKVADICHYVLAGNTTMMHLLSGMPPEAISRAPFIPVSRRMLSLAAAELGLPVAPDALCHLLPSIASYVGADITAGILACGLHRQDLAGGGAVLLLDIGTNGEIVLAGPQGIVACSTAAGPAFEGANILCGTGGIVGAIDKVACQDGKLTCSVISDKNGGSEEPVPACGICGSGLVSAVACLLDCGLIDETGRITGEPEILPAGLDRLLTSHNGQPAIVIVPAADNSTGRDIVLTQKDIRELQNAKAAIAAGIALLIHQAGLTPEKISRTYIAGGFGNYLDVASAFRIGLLPPELIGRTTAVGNAAGMGAILCLLNADAINEAETVAGNVHYFELSGDSRFTDLYVDAMYFPEKDDQA